MLNARNVPLKGGKLWHPAQRIAVARKRAQKALTAEDREQAQRQEAVARNDLLKIRRGH